MGDKQPDVTRSQGWGVYHEWKNRDGTVKRSWTSARSEAEARQFMDQVRGTMNRHGLPFTAERVTRPGQALPAKAKHYGAASNQLEQGVGTRIAHWLVDRIFKGKK